MLHIFLIAIAALTLAFSNAQSTDTTLTGAIVTSQFTCPSPCTTWNLVIAKTDYVKQVGVETYTVLQELLPYAPASSRSFATFTAYDAISRSFVVAASDYPKEGSATFWVSTVNNDITAATPVVAEVTIAYPISTSPFPLNVSPLKMSRLLYGANSALYVTFVNGEVHEMNLAEKSSKKLLSIISDEQMMSPSFPQVSWSQVYDPATNSIFSVVTAGSGAFLSKVSLTDLSVGSWIKLNNDMLKDVQWSPETFINAHMVQLDPTEPAKLCITMESLENVGFDEILFVDTTTGVTTAIQDNLMDDNILLTCPAFECDMWRVSTYDPVNNKMYFQGHVVENGVVTGLAIYYVSFYQQKSNEKWTWAIAPTISPSQYGYSGFQYVQIVK